MTRRLESLARLAGVIWRTPTNGLALLKRSWARHWVRITVTLVVVVGLAVGLWMDGSLIWGSAAPTGSNGAYEEVGAPVVTISPRSVVTITPEPVLTVGPNTTTTAAPESTMTGEPKPTARIRAFEPAWSGDKFGRAALGASTGKMLYVADSGDDSDSGANAEVPLRSPQTALDRAEPGDMICVAPGTYQPGISWEKTRYVLVATKGGRIDAPITMSSCGQDGVLFAGPVALANQYFRLEGITVSGSKYDGVTDDGAGITVVAIKNMPEPESLELRDVRINGFAEAGFKQQGGSNIALVAMTVEGIARFDHGTGEGIVLVNGRGTIVANSLVRASAICGVRVQGGVVDAKLVNDTIHDNRSGVCADEGAQVTIANSIFTTHRSVGDKTNGYAVRGGGATVRCSLAWDNARKSPFDAGSLKDALKLTDSPYGNAEDYIPTGAAVDRGLDWGLLRDRAGKRRDERPDVGAFEAPDGPRSGPRCAS